MPCMHAYVQTHTSIHPRMLIADGDAGAVMSLLQLACLSVTYASTTSTIPSRASQRQMPPLLATVHFAQRTIVLLGLKMFITTKVPVQVPTAKIDCVEIPSEFAGKVQQLTPMAPHSHMAPEGTRQHQVVPPDDPRWSQKWSLVAGGPRAI